MGFADQIRACPPPFRFARAIDAAASLVGPGLCASAFRRAGGGVLVLESEARLNDYLVAYGEMHVAKILSFLPSIPLDAARPLAIVDWGCGQGLAAAVAIEYLRTAHPSLRVSAVRLIEKSAAARARAGAVVSRYGVDDVQLYDWDLAVLSSDGLDLPAGDATRLAAFFSGNGGNR